LNYLKIKIKNKIKEEIEILKKLSPKKIGDQFEVVLEKNLKEGAKDIYPFKVTASDGKIILIKGKGGNGEKVNIKIIKANPEKNFYKAKIVEKEEIKREIEKKEKGDEGDKDDEEKALEEIIKEDFKKEIIITKETTLEELEQLAQTVLDKLKELKDILLSESEKLVKDKEIFEFVDELADELAKEDKIGKEKIDEINKIKEKIEKLIIKLFGYFCLLEMKKKKEF
jgi:hypothetical protein